MNVFIVNGLGLLIIAGIIYWFWLSKPGAQKAEGETAIDVIVDNGVYDPARIEVPAGKTVTLRFIRKDASPCAAKVVFDDLGVTEELPVGKPHDVMLKIDEPGEYAFTCEMQMYRGVLQVV